ncbi:hypothetical protein ARSEF1564_006270 [Beauveria bassiana]
MAPAKAAELRHSTPLAPAIRGRDDGREPTSSSSSSSSVSGSVAVIASPPTENEGTSPPRQKRWATKTRTGCITCRIRRVKCDEAKPMCNRCMTSGRMCDGYKSPPQKPSKQTASTPSESVPEPRYLWTAFHASMSTMLAVINERLSSPDGPTNDSVFVRIVDLLSIDLTLLGSTWKAHLHGYGALYKMRGGYTRLSKRIKSFDYQFQYVFMLHVLTSTTTPAAQMLTIFDDLTPEETHHVFTFTLYTDVPCSSHVFADLIRINRLRALVAGGASVQSFVLPAARQVYKHIAEFSVTDWEEPYGVPDKPEARLLCRIFQKAVLLYGLLTLPPLSLAPTTTTTTPTDDNEASSNLPSPEVTGSEADIDDGEALHDGDADPAPTPSTDTLRVEILSLIREVLPLIAERPTSLAWPLAVVGVTLTGQGDAAERDFVTQTLRRISTHRDAYYGPTLCLGKLHKFWASGKTGWEDCYDEACSVMA